FRLDSNAWRDAPPPWRLAFALKLRTSGTCPKCGSPAPRVATNTVATRPLAPPITLSFHLTRRRLLWWSGGLEANDEPRSEADPGAIPGHRRHPAVTAATRA